MVKTFLFLSPEMLTEMPSFISFLAQFRSVLQRVLCIPWLMTHAVDSFPGAVIKYSDKCNLVGTDSVSEVKVHPSCQGWEAEVTGA